MCVLFKGKIRFFPSSTVLCLFLIDEDMENLIDESGKNFLESNWITANGIINDK